MKTFLVAIIVIVSGTAIECNSSNQGEPESTDAGNISMLRLIAAPDAYDGRWVTTIGYVRVGMERNALYYARADLDNPIPLNAIALDFEKCGGSGETVSREAMLAYDGQAVMLKGLFRVGPAGHGGFYQSRLCSISRIISYPTRLPRGVESGAKPSSSHP